MDVYILTHLDKTKNINQLYKEMLKNCKKADWHKSSRSGLTHRFGNLQLEYTGYDYFDAITKESWIVVERWM